MTGIHLISAFAITRFAQNDLTQSLMSAPPALQGLLSMQSLVIMNIRDDDDDDDGDDQGEHA